MVSSPRRDNLRALYSALRRKKQAIREARGIERNSPKYQLVIGSPRHSRRPRRQGPSDISETLRNVGDQ
jgi:hypothetical protein